MDQVSEIRERTDIVELISEYIPLKKLGRNFKTTCPFHNEKTPSFVVSPERQIWHCFGCNKGGDCFSFLMEYEKLEFPEALRILAKKAGIELKTSSYQTGVADKKEKIYELNRLALDFYHYILTKHSVGKSALSYLTEKRKLDKGLIETFKLGFSPKSGNSLSNFLVGKKKYKDAEVLEAGLAFETRNGIMDFFRGRVMFPLFDHRGNVVGFSGRVIDAVSDGGKYVNTRETLVYHKGSMFFGLDTAKEEIKKEDKAIIVEGEFDVISMFSQGIKNVIAVKGTALTENQASLLSRFTKNVALCFDKDSAGYEATKRSLPILEKQKLIVTIVEIPDGKDADEAIKSNPGLFKKNLKKDINIYDYFFDKLVSSQNLQTIEGKRKSFEMLPLIAQIENEIVKEHFLKKISEALDTSYESITREIEKLQKKDDVPVSSFSKKEKISRREILEQYLLALIIQSDEHKRLFDKAFEVLQDYKFITPAFEKITASLSDFFKSYEKFDAKNFSKFLASELTKTFDLCFLYPLFKFPDELKAEKEIEKVSVELRALFIKDKIKILSQDLKSKEKEEKEAEIQELQKELSGLIYLLSGS